MNVRKCFGTLEFSARNSICVNCRDYYACKIYDPKKRVVKQKKKKRVITVVKQEQYKIEKEE